jgi:hypothetical protein
VLILILVLILLLLLFSGLAVFVTKLFLIGLLAVVIAGLIAGLLNRSRA